MTLSIKNLDKGKDKGTRLTFACFLTSYTWYSFAFSFATKISYAYAYDNFPVRTVRKIWATKEWTCLFFK